MLFQNMVFIFSKLFNRLVFEPLHAFLLFPAMLKGKKKDLTHNPNCRLLSSVIDWRTHKAGKTERHYTEQKDDWPFDACV